MRMRIRIGIELSIGIMDLCQNEDDVGKKDGYVKIMKPSKWPSKRRK
jgi:hypothetical protein